MSNNTAMAELTAVLLQKLKDEVQYWQEKALSASEANNEEECCKALRAQGQAINTLIKMAEAAARQYS